MEYVRLGATGVMVSRLCLGAMMFGQWGNPDHDESIDVIRTALDSGINFIDTADVYSKGESEEIVGKALKGRNRDDVILATKFHTPMGEGPNDRGNSRKYIFRAVEASLRRLGTDYIDLYQAHRPDPLTDVGETLTALTDLIRQGKVRYAGSSTFPAADIVEAQWVASERKLERFVCEQPPYSILVREIERAILPAAQKHRMGVIVWSPLAGGWLSGKFRRGRPVEKTGRASRIPARFDETIPGNQRKYDAVEQLVPLAEEAGFSLVELAVAWVLEHPAVTSAIIGPRTLEQLKGQLSAGEIKIPQDVLDRIDEIVPPGTTLNPADNGYDPVWILQPQYRRRSLPSA
ncbi:MAG TPA: aldo/keto reductase [Actinomycetota bacterium]|nr:aldo/keto reductase [Actinomycetota bacterium]